MDRNTLDDERMPRPGEAGLRSYLPEQPDWMREIQRSPLVSKFLGEALPLALMGLRGPSPARLSTATIKPQAALEPPERPVQAAMKIGDNIYEGYNHGLALSKAEQALGPEALWSQWNKKNGFGPDSEGFVTNKGRYVSRQEATDLLGQFKENPGELHHDSLNHIRFKNRFDNPELLAGPALMAPAIANALAGDEQSQ